MTASRLTRFIDLPEGLDMRTALANARANAEAYRERALSQIDTDIAALLAAGEMVAPETASRLAESIGSMAGMFGLSALEQSARRLCDMIRALAERSTWDRTSVWVNIQALKIIRQHGDSENLGEILAGLQQLAKRAEGPSTA